MSLWAQRFVVLATTAALLVACAPITREGVQTAPGSTIPLPTVTPTATLEPTLDTTAMATVITRALRVRQEPTVNSPLVGDIANGESYPVIGRSSDGMWLKLALPQFDLGSGWVSVDLVTMRGDITDLPIIKIPTPPPPTATPIRPPATATPVVELPTPTPEGGAVVTDTVEATVEATAEPTTEATAEPTIEATIEPTAQPTVGESAPVTKTAPLTETVAVTETAPEAPTPAPTAEGIAAPAAGSATVTAEWRVRIRAEPNTEAPIVGFGYRGETFPVLEVSGDGQWVRLGGSPATPENTDGGWVSAQFLAMGR